MVFPDGQLGAICFINDLSSYVDVDQYKCLYFSILLECGAGYGAVVMSICTFKFTTTLLGMTDNLLKQ